MCPLISVNPEAQDMAGVTLAAERTAETKEGVSLKPSSVGSRRQAVQKQIKSKRARRQT